MKSIFLSILTCLFLIWWFLPAAGQDITVCPPGQPAYPVDPGIGCSQVTGYFYDLGITPWDTLTHRSPDISIGNSGDGTPNFHIYQSTTPGVYTFYTGIGAKITNNSGDFVCPNIPINNPVSVSFWYAECSDPSTVDTINSWTHIGDYELTIPTAPGAIAVNGIHESHPVCWQMSPPGTEFPDMFIIKAQINWGYDEDNTNNTAYSFYDLSALKHEAHIGFAMDLSGSMSGNFSGSTSKKLDVAKEKAQLFVFLIENNQYLGVYGFASGNSANDNFTTTYTGTDIQPHTVTLGGTNVISPMHAITGNSDRLTIINSINNQVTHNATPIGQGLLRAKKGIDDMPSTSPLTPSKAIVLFSDGLQNVSPFVYPPFATSTPLVDIDVQRTFAENGIPIYAINFGQTIGWSYDFMSRFQNQNTGQYVYGTCSEVELATIYYTIRGMVDDMLYLEQDGLTSTQGPWPPFEVNFDEAAVTATVSAAWELGNSETKLTIERRKKGDCEWIVNNSKETSKSFEVYRFEPGPNTTWEFRVKQMSPVMANEVANMRQAKFAAAVFSNVAVGRIHASIDAAGFETGKPLPVYIDLHSGTHPFTDAVVKAHVKIPARSFSTLLRKYYKKFSIHITPLPALDLTLIPILHHFESALKRDTGSEKIYTYRDVELTLKDDGVLPDKQKGDGRYTAILSPKETLVAGDYSVTFTATGALPSGKQFKRVTKLSAICNVGPADKRKSKVEVTLSPFKGKTQLATFTILPMDKFGNAAFPGSAHRINVVPGEGKLAGEIKDNLDSSFSQDVIVETGKKASVNISVDKVSLGTFKAAYKGGK